MGKYVLIKTKEGLLRGLKTLYYRWKGSDPPNDLLLLKPIREDVSPWINYTWWSNPAPGVPAEFFAIAWLGFIYVDKAGVYRFYVTTDDGSRVWVDEKLLIDAWKDQPPTTYVSEPIPLSEGYHRLKYYFYNRYAFAQAVLGWIPQEGEAGVIPKDRFYHVISDRVFFEGVPEDYTVEVLPSGAEKKICISRGGVCGIRVLFDELPMEAIIRVLDTSGGVVYETPEKITLWGGDEIKLAEIK